ncbi:MAG: hypothetical protein GY873_13825 [Bosea sp.]|uniref:hypothetical protein n=1 Tax=Bosea sp. (in: a-proteobacteria) TaxID=1871050 RepID=UPI0023983261|nr:hypothetical protein [Bosea sp. (in: a-proteobacteria)]
MSDFIVGAATKGITKRSVQEEMALRVRFLNGTHIEDVYQRVKDEIGKRADEIGPLDLSRNTLKSYASRLGTAYRTPPLVSGLSERLARLIGDQSAKTTVGRYRAADGRPMPTRMVQESARALLFRLACNYAGTLVDWSARSKRPYIRLITPDELRVEYASDDPFRPTIIGWSHPRKIDGKVVLVEDVYDLTDERNPSMVVYKGKIDVTQKATGRTYKGDDYIRVWSYKDGRPFHPIVISGDPRRPYVNVELVEVALSVCVAWSHWRASVRDAGHPQRNVRGLQLAAADSDAESGSTGVDAAPETVVEWVDIYPDRPGTHWQDGPGFDPLVIGQAIRTYELTALSALGVPVDFEQTGGEPTEREAEALRELEAGTFPDCRRHDALVLRRAAAVHNRATEADPTMEAANLSEAPLATLYRSEVDEALGAVEPEEDEEEDDVEEDTDDG